jgi:hypothetical protein
MKWRPEPRSVGEPIMRNMGVREMQNDNQMNAHFFRFLNVRITHTFGQDFNFGTGEIILLT